VHAAFPTNKTDRNDIGEILLKVALNTINITLTIMLTRHVKYRLLVTCTNSYENRVPQTDMYGHGNNTIVNMDC
jgi:hypothetical protein